MMYRHVRRLGRPSGWPPLPTYYRLISGSAPSQLCSGPYQDARKIFVLTFRSCQASGRQPGQSEPI